jgi:S1-C subfamily serine protease
MLQVRLGFLLFVLLLNSPACTMSVSPATSLHSPEHAVKAADAINASRASAVEIRVHGNMRNGTGFLITERHVVTAFHVIALDTPSPGGKRALSILPGLNVRLPDDEIVEADCVSQPTEVEPEPYQYDFAILKLRRSPRTTHRTLRLDESNDRPAVGDEIYFSGFPLAIKGLATHRGMVSGSDAARSQVFLQAALNKGNSGGAILTADGKIVGVISQREGSPSPTLQEIQRRIMAEEQRTDIQVRAITAGVDVRQVTRELIGTVDTYISTGIGYAVPIRFLRDYLDRHPNLLNK